MLNPKLYRLVAALDRECDGSEFSAQFNLAVVSSFTAGHLDYKLDENGDLILKLTKEGRAFYGRKPH